MKTIGLVGGMTPESTRIYYELLIRGARRPGADPLRNPKIIIYSIDLADLVSLQRAGKRDEIVEYLSAVVGRLELAGAEIAALTANTPHAYLDELRTVAALPLVSIVTATRDAASAQGLRHALLLGTRTTMESGIYSDELGNDGIRVTVPDRAGRRFLDDVIYGELALGRVRPEVRQRFLDICSHHIEHDGVDSVILGCTEIPLVIQPDDLPVAVLDTTVIHARAILAAAGSPPA
jgi:aspartate racemase